MLFNLNKAEGQYFEVSISHDGDIAQAVAMVPNLNWSYSVQVDGYKANGDSQNPAKMPESYTVPGVSGPESNGVVLADPQGASTVQKDAELAKKADLLEQKKRETMKRREAMARRAEVKKLAKMVKQQAKVAKRGDTA
jgi:hypothetical protein